MQIHSASHTLQQIPSINDESEVSEQEGKARTICETTENIACTILQFSGSRDWQRYNDGETQPEGTQNKLPPSTQWD